MGTRTNDRFAGYDADGDLISLVAEGLPDWPESGDLTDAEAYSDETIGAMHEAYAAEASALLAEGAEPNPGRMAELTERIPALRAEAARRLAAAAPDDDPAADPALAELEGLSEDELAEVVAYAEAVAAAAADDEDPEAGALAAALRDVLAGRTHVTGDVLLAPAVDPAAVATATAQGIGEAIRPVVESLERAATRLASAPAIPATARRTVDARTLAEYNQGREQQLPPDQPRPRGRLVYAGDSRQGMANGSEINEMGPLVRAFQERGRLMGSPVAADDERMIIAQVIPDEPTDERFDFRGLRDASVEHLREKIERVAGREAVGIDPWTMEERPIGRGGIIVQDPSSLTASGGLAAPVEPYYPQLVVARADRQVAGAMPGMMAERGGIRLVLPPSLGTLTSATQPGYFTDGSSTDTSATFTSATAAFTDSDVGSPIVEVDGGTHIPAGTIISAVGSSSSITLSQNAVGTATGIGFKIVNRNPNNLGAPVGVVTAAQDAAGPPSVIKYTYDVPIGTQAEHDVYSVYTSLQFANLTARTFPEQVEANIRLAAALAARTADTQMLNYITGWSTLLTFAKTFGTARQLLAQFDHMAAFYRNFNRMDPRAVLRLGVPAWVINAMRGDYVSTFIGGGDNWSLSDDELQAWFQDRSILPFFYWDGPSDVSQLFPAVGSGAINTGGVNNATPVAVPDYPGSGATTSFRTKVVSFMWAEGTWLNLSTGELNLGLVRDSILNSQNRFRNFEEIWETPAFVGLQSLRCVHTVAADGTYGASASVTLGAGSGL